jgi:hypothetical protein
VTRRWSEDEVIALGVKGTVAEVASIVGLGGKGNAYRLLREGRFPFPTFEMNGQTWVPMRPVRELLGIETSPTNSTTTGEDESPVAVEPVRRSTDDGNQNNTRRLRPA